MDPRLTTHQTETKRLKTQRLALLLYHGVHIASKIAQTGKQTTIIATHHPAEDHNR